MAIAEYPILVLYADSCLRNGEAERNHVLRLF
jgi:hypothetical protein